MVVLRKARMEELCELVTDGTHDSPKLQKEGVPFIKGKNISGGAIDFSTCDFITLEDHREACRRVKPQRGDILFSNIGSVGDTAVVKYDREFSIKNVALFRPDQNKVDRTYFYYLILSPEFRSSVMNIRSGSAQPFVSLANLRSFEVRYIEDGATQKRIAEILSAYDELIENSQQRIKILESMARALYREWFVHFRYPGHESVPLVPSALGDIPQGWEVTTLGQLVNLKKGKNITKATIRDGIVPVVAGGLEPAYFHDVPNTHGPVITISASGANAGYVHLYHVDVWASDCSYIDSRASAQIFYYYLWLDHRRVTVTHLQRGSAQPHVYTKDLEDLEALRVPEGLLANFCSKMMPIFELIKITSARINSLHSTRDLLLPRLLSGQIEVSGVYETGAA
jgi:type I restriction enzyme S subunit